MGDWRIQAYINWLCTPTKERDPRTQTDFAKSLGLDRQTLNDWQNDATFLAEWERYYLKTIGNPGRKSQIMDTLFKTATDGDDPKHVAAAKEYFAIEGSLRPQALQVSVRRDPSSLSDEEIAGLLAEHAENEQNRRLRAVGDGD